MVKKVSKTKQKQSQKQTVIVNVGSKRGSAPPRLKTTPIVPRYIPSADKFIQPNTIIQQHQNLGELLKSLRAIDNPVSSSLASNPSAKAAPSIEASKPVSIPRPKAIVPALGGIPTPVPTLGNPFSAPKSITEAVSQSSGGLSSFVKSKLETPFQFIASKLVAEEPKPKPEPSLERTAPAIGGTTPALEFVGKTGRSLEVASLTESGADTPSADALVPQRTFVEGGYEAFRPKRDQRNKRGLSPNPAKTQRGGQPWPPESEKTVLKLLTPDEPSSIVPDEVFYEFPEDEEPVVVQGTAEPAISPILDEGGGAPTEPSTADVLTPSVPLAPTSLTLATGRAEEAPPPEASDLGGGGGDPGTPRAKSSRKEDYRLNFNMVKEYLKDAGRPDDDDTVQEILKTHPGQNPAKYLRDEYPVIVSPPAKAKAPKKKKEK